MLRLRWRAQVHTIAGARLHQRIGERRAPADVAMVKVHLVDADDRDDVFEAGGVPVGHGCESTATNPSPSPPYAGRYTVASRFRCHSYECGSIVRGLRTVCCLAAPTS